MTPYEIDILMHYYTRPTDHSGIHDGNQLWRDTMADFLTLGLLDPNGNDTAYVLGERGRVFIEAIIALPLPERLWVMPK